MKKWCKIYDDCKRAGKAPGSWPCARCEMNTSPRPNYFVKKDK